MADMIPRTEADARVAAAYEAAAKDVSDWGELLCGIESVTEEVVYDIRALTPDDARAALEAMLAEAEKRGEKRGMLRGAEIYRNELAQVAASAEAGPVFEAAPRAETAIRAEAEE
jgi:hypothetical protein